MSDYVRSYNLSEPDDELLAVDGDGVTPSQNLNKLSGDVNRTDGDIDIQKLVDLAIPTTILTPKQQIKILKASNNPSDLAKLGPLLELEQQRKIDITSTLKKYPNVKQYGHLFGRAVEEWDLFANVKYGQCEAVDGTVKDLGKYDELQEAVDRLSLEHGIEFKNPHTQDAFDSANTKHLLQNNKGPTLVGTYGRSRGRSRNTIRKATESQIDNVASGGSLETMGAVISILGGNIIRNRKPGTGFKFLSGYKKNPLSKFNQKELGELDGVMKKLDPDWGGYIVDGIKLFKRANFNNLSKDAAKLLGHDVTGIFKSLMKISKQEKFDRKVDDRIKKIKG